MGPDEGPEVLSRRLFHVSVAGGPKGGHEHRSLGHPAGPGVGQGNRLAGVVDEDLLAGPVVLAHDHVELAAPEPVALAELRVLVPFRLPVLVLKPQELEGHPFAAELSVGLVPVRLRAPAALAGVA